MCVYILDCAVCCICCVLGFLLAVLCVCVCCISWTVLYQPLTASMGEFVRGSITQLNARKHFSKEMMNTICRAAIQLPSNSAVEKKFIDVNTHCSLNFLHIIPHFTGVCIFFLFFHHCAFNFLFESLSHVGVGSWQGWR